MPADPANIDRIVVLSDGYHDQPARIEFYTNSAIAIQRGSEINGDRVWLDRLETQALRAALQED